jgi:hypothetical protein
MGFLSGVVGELNRQEDKAARREEFMMNLLEKRKAAILPQLMERIEKRNSATKARAARVSAAVGFGMTKEAAAVLESSGNLTNLLTRLNTLDENPEKTISRAGIERLSEAVVANLKPEKVASAMAYAFDMGYAEEPTSDKLIEAIYANTSEEFSTALTPLMSAASQGGEEAPGISRFSVNPMSLTSMNTEKTAKVRKYLSETLAGQLGGNYNDETKKVTWENPDAAGEIIQNAVEYFKVQLSDPLNQKDETDIYREIFDKINLLTGYKDLRDIATNYPTFEFTPPTTTPPPPGSSDGGGDPIPAPVTSATEDIYDEGEI